MSSLYFRRWTRMYVYPAAKYFKKYNAIQPGFENFQHIANTENPMHENKRYFKKTLLDPDEELNNKLIKNLFLKYPDLKYQSINRQKYQGDNFNSYSYSFAFISEQKKLIKAGYTIQKSFQIVESKFQQKMKRKIDQTLLSKGLAIGNRARSLMSIYQQQVQYQSRLKMLRTKRQILKYEQQLKQIDQALQKSVEIGQDYQNQKQHYQRIFQKVSEQSVQQINKEYKDQKRGVMISRIRGDFQNMFKQFYQNAACKDRLRGLTDDEIKQNILKSPSKIKRLSRQLVRFLKLKGGVSVNLNNQIKMNDQINDKLKQFIQYSPTIKVAILNDLTGYGNNINSYQNKVQAQAKDKLNKLQSLKPAQLSQQDKQTIKINKIKQFQQVVQKSIPDDYRTYNLLESDQERKLRLQIKYLQSFIKNSEKPNDTIFNKLSQTIDKFRRLKFRLQKRHKNIAYGQLQFPEHYIFDKTPDQIEDENIQYQDLIQYLRKRTQERRLKTIDQVDDNKINEMIQKQSCEETPKPQGEQKNLI